MQHFFKPYFLTSIHCQFICIRSKSNNIAEARTFFCLESEDLFCGLEAIHDGHHEVHDYELEEIFGAFFILADVVEMFFEFLDGIFAISGFFREDLVV